MYSDATPNEYLAHYGVLGMKWGRHLFGRARDGYDVFRKSPRQFGRNAVNNYRNANKRIGGAAKTAAKKIGKAHVQAVRTLKNTDKRPYAKKALDITGDIALTGGQIHATRAFKKTKAGKKADSALREFANRKNAAYDKAGKAIKDFMPKKGALKRRAKRADEARRKQAKAKYDYRSGKITRSQARKQSLASIGNFYKETYGRKK